uniref:Uncharacterized protein n=1 Tax=Rhizophora mucronata TaxID=61149 RepID=A0A2P2QTP5_RHIMU
MLKCQQVSVKFSMKNSIQAYQVQAQKNVD